MKQRHLQVVIQHLESEVSNLSKETIGQMEDSMMHVCIQCMYVCVCVYVCTVMSHLLMGTKFSDFATFVFSVPWFRGSARSCHISFHSVK